MPNYRYRIRSTGYSSARFGPCEICGKHVSDVHSQVEEVEYTWDGIKKWTRYECSNYFGHKECLEKQRR